MHCVHAWLKWELILSCPGRYCIKSIKPPQKPMIMTSRLCIHWNYKHFFFQIQRLKVSFWRSSDKSTSWIKMLLKCRLLQRLVAPTSHSQDSREGCCTLERLNTSAECTPALICDGREDNRGLISSYQDIKHLPEHF